MAKCAEVPGSNSQPYRLRRDQPRYALRSLVYVKLDHANGGIIRDLTESGVAIQAVAQLRPDDAVNISFELPSPRVRIQVMGRVVWSDAGCQAGIQFYDFLPRSRRALRDWLFIPLLATAAVCGNSSIFAPQPLRHDERNVNQNERTLSRTPRDPIPIAAKADSAAKLDSRIALGFFSLSATRFSLYVDSLVIMCAILSFSITAIALMGEIPAWPLATALFVTASTIFVAVYQLLFSDLVCGATPGQRLAVLGASSSARENQTQRFR